MQQPDQSKDKSKVTRHNEKFDETTAIPGATESGLDAHPGSEQSEWIGRKLGKYQVTGSLGAGGMGMVLKAHDGSIGRDVAIKVLPTSMAADEVALQRFLSEARSAGRLNHPNTVTIYEVAEEEGIHYLVMEVVDGGSAADHLERNGAYSVEQATRMVSEACDGLSAAHESGLVHRDIKPANLLLTRTGRVKVSDFGLAKQKRSDSMQMTKAGQIVGTPYYMSPEQCESRKVDARSDVYSLGATYYGLLTGKDPYAESDSVVQVMYSHCNMDPPDPRQSGINIPDVCAKIVAKAMAKRSEDRYQSVKEMKSDLDAVLASFSNASLTLPSESLKSSSSNVGKLVWAVGACVLLGLLAFFIFSRGNNSPNLPNESRPQAAAPTGIPIKIGILHSMTGTMAGSESPVVDAVRLAVDQINESGGLLGRPVEAVVADGRSDDSVFALEARRLILEEKVCTVFGCWTSASRKTVVPIFEELNSLLVYPVQYEGIEESPNVIYVGASPNQQILPALKWAFAFEGKRRFFLVGSDYVFPRVAHEIIKDELKELGGQLVGEAFIRLGSREVDDVVKAIKSAKADVILNCINGDSNTAFFEQLRKAGIAPAEVPTISFSIGEAELQHLDVKAMVGDYAAWNYFQSIDSPENADFVNAFQKKYGAHRVLTDPMESAFFGTKLWARAVLDAKSTDPAEIRRSLRNQRMIAPGGAVRIDATTQHTFKTPRIGRVKADGQFEIVWTAAKQESPIPYPPTRTAEVWRAFLHDLYKRWGDQWAAPVD